MVKSPPANAGDARVSSLIPGLERSPGVGNGNPLQYFCLENFTGRGTWRSIVCGVTESDTTERLTHFHFVFEVIIFLYGEEKQFERMRMDVRGHLGSPSQRCQELKTDRADRVDRQRGQHCGRGIFHARNEI